MISILLLELAAAIAVGAFGYWIYENAVREKSWALSVMLVVWILAVAGFVLDMAGI